MAIKETFDASRSEEDRVSQSGKLLVITGRSAVGKDSLAKCPDVEAVYQKYRVNWVVTHASRAPRAGEIPDRDYHFVSETELFRMHRDGELVEAPVQTGSSYKATSKKELLRVLNGENLVWRIDLSLAANIASGHYFAELFAGNPELVALMNASTRVVLINAEIDCLEGRSQKREGEKFDPEEFKRRIAQENILVEETRRHVKHRVANNDGQMAAAVSELIQLVEDFLS
jgi:guanylate kinase